MKLRSDVMERYSVYGKLLYLGYRYEKGRCSTGRWKRKYRDEVYRHLLFLKKVLELMMEKSAEADEIMLMTFRDFSEKEENTGKHYLLSLKGSEILDKEKNLIFTEEEDISNKFIDFLMYEMTNDCLNELKKTFVNKRKIHMLLRALHNLPRVYLWKNVDALCNVCNGLEISPCEAIEYSFANMDTETKKYYTDLARSRGIIS